MEPIVPDPNKPVSLEVAIIRNMFGLYGAAMLNSTINTCNNHVNDIFLVEKFIF